jgi:prophage antirepressor-like protein
MSKIVNFSNAAFSVECIVVDDMPWFKGREVATILNYVNTKQAIINNVSNDDKKTLEELGGLFDRPLPYYHKNAIYINEPGLYSLVMRSEKPEATAFKKWVMSEVLPSMRKTGQYRILDLPQAATAKDLQRGGPAPKSDKLPQEPSSGTPTGAGTGGAAGHRAQKEPKLPQGVQGRTARPADPEQSQKLPWLRHRIQNT